MPKGGEHRFYRYQHHCRKGWFSFRVVYLETDLWIRALSFLEKEALESVLKCRYQLNHYIESHPEFLKSLRPIDDDPLAPPLVRSMIEAGRHANVGPMAAVAGAIAQSVALDLKEQSPHIVIENGGDCYMNLAEEITVGIYAGPDSPFSGKIAIRFKPDRFPLGICTSSGTVGHSLSFGKADAVTVIAKDAALADAAATALGNHVKTPGEIKQALELAQSIPDLEGALILVKDSMGAWGNLEIVPV